MKNEKRYPSSTLKLVTGMTSKSSKPSCTFCITYLNGDNGLFSPLLLLLIIIIIIMTMMMMIMGYQKNVFTIILVA